MMMMTAFFVPLALFLAAIFLVSAIGKLRSSDRGRAGFDALQIRVARPDAAAGALIVAEALTAVSLIVTTGMLFVVATAAALALTVGLLVVVVRAHRLGSSDDCGCFGDWLPAAIGPKLIARNIVLVVIAGVLFATAVLVYGLLGRPIGVPVAFAAGPGSVTVLGVLIALLLIALATWSTARASVEASASRSRITHGAGAVVIPATSEVVDLLSPGARARLLLFVSPGCHACATALHHLQDVQQEVTALTDVYVVQKLIHGSIGAESDHAIPASARFALDVGGSLGETLDLGIARPVAVLIGADGTQAGPVALGSEETTVLIDSIVSLADASTS